MKKEIKKKVIFIVSVVIIGAAAVILVPVLFSKFSSADTNTNSQTNSEQSDTSEIMAILPTETQQTVDSPVVDEVDWSDYFHGLTGSAVVYIPRESRYAIHNREQSSIRRSPCSTFKIISSLAGLEHGIIPAEDSTRKWSGETFWNDRWNKDIGFQEAFQSSCVWYYREVINELGQDVIQNELDKLNYGNGDISDWEGNLNNNNNNPMLTGFWIESSLKISPEEQVGVMERIFGGETYSTKTLNRLKEAMQVSDAGLPDIRIFGKTGTGMSDGKTVDAWFTGFAEIEEETVYFCVYLGQSDNQEISSAEAKKIAIQIINDIT